MRCRHVRCRPRQRRLDHPARALPRRPTADARDGRPALLLSRDARRRAACDRRLPPRAAPGAAPGAARGARAGDPDPDALLPPLRAASGDGCGTMPDARPLARPVRAAGLCARRRRRARHRGELRHARRVPLAARARGQPRGRRLDRSATLVGWHDRRHRRLLCRRRVRFPGEHRASGGARDRAAVRGLGHVGRPLLSGRPAAAPAGGDVRRADARTRPRPAGPAGALGLLRRPGFRRAGAGGRGRRWFAA